MTGPYDGLIERLTDPDADSLMMHEACLDAAAALSRLTRDVEECVEALKSVAELQGFCPASEQCESCNKVRATLNRLSGMDNKDLADG